jgi:hypothetical protein
MDPSKRVDFPSLPVRNRDGGRPGGQAPHVPTSTSNLGGVFSELERLLGAIFEAPLVVAPTTTLAHLAALPERRSCFAPRSADENCRPTRVETPFLAFPRRWRIPRKSPRHS